MGEKFYPEEVIYEDGRVAWVESPPRPLFEGNIRRLREAEASTMPAIDWIAVEKAWADHLKAGRGDDLYVGDVRYPWVRVEDAELVERTTLAGHGIVRRNPRLCSGRYEPSRPLTPLDGAIEPHEDGADGGGDVEGVEQARDVLPHEALAERPHSG